MHAEHPELVKDAFWDEGVPEELPYTLAAEEFRAEPWQGSAAEVKWNMAFFSSHMRIDIHDFRFQYRSNRVNLSIWTPLLRWSQARRRMLRT